MINDKQSKIDFWTINLLLIVSVGLGLFFLLDNSVNVKAAVPYIIDGNNVYINDSEKFMLVTPTNLYGDTANLQFQSKVLEGAFKLAILVNNTPENYFEVTGINFVTYQNVLRNYTTSYIDNQTLENITQIVYYNESVKNVTNYPIVIDNFTFQDKTVAYEIQNVQIVRNQLYDIEIVANHDGNGKYDIVGYMNSRTLDWATTHNQYVMLDPWYNVSGNTTYSESNLQNGMRDYWKLDETTGTNVFNSVNSSRNGTATASMPSFTSGKINYARNNTGGSGGGYTTVSSYGNIDNFTVSSWVNFNSFTCTSECDIFGVQTTPSWNVFKFGLHTAYANKIFLFAGSGAPYVSATTSALSINTWYHIVAVRNGTTTVLYVNGVKDYTVVGGTGTLGTIAVGTAAAKIGTVGGVTDHSVPAIIDEVGVWNRAFSPDEVALLYNITKDGASTGQFPFNISTSDGYISTLTLFYPLNMTYHHVAPNFTGNCSGEGNLNASLYINNSLAGISVVNSTTANFSITPTYTFVNFTEYDWYVNCTAYGTNGGTSMTNSSETRQFYYRGLGTPTGGNGTTTVLPTCLKVLGYGCTAILDGACTSILNSGG